MRNLSPLKLRGLALVFLLVGIGLVTGVTYYNKNIVQPSPYLVVHFLDVGQGDAIFIETPDRVQVLIDGGPDGSVIRELGEVMSPFDKTIDLVIATHNDKDHIGGLIDVLARYQVSAIMRTNNQHDTSVVQQFTKQVEAEQAVLISPEAGQRYIVGASTTLTVFSPVGDVSDHESNASSVVVKLDYGGTSFFLTGDAPIGIEEYLAKAYPAELSSTVLKLGHHGSRTSSSAVFLASVLPAYSVVSASAGNSYGHPHAEVVENVKSVDSTLLSTAEMGRISFYSDGERVWVKNK
ncbi:MAG: ComEC/Rec2 family competence protein [Candidatus Paceibacteria bacterium]